MAGPGLMPIFMPSVTAEFSLQSTFFSSANAMSYTDPGVDLGDDVPSRLIIVVIAAKHDDNGQGIINVTVGGQALTQRVFFNNNGNSVNGSVAIYSGQVTGTSGSVSVSFDFFDAMEDCMIGTYRAVNLNSNSMFDSDGGTSESMSLNIPANGIAVGAVSYVTSPSSVSWTGLTENMDELGNSAASSIASAGILAAETGRAISVASGGSPSRYCCASFG